MSFLKNYDKLNNIYMLHIKYQGALYGKKKSTGSYKC